MREAGGWSAHPPCTQWPTPEQLKGHASSGTANWQPAPPQPDSHVHVPSAPHTPCAEHSSGHARMSQRSPYQPGGQRQALTGEPRQIPPLRHGDGLHSSTVSEQLAPCETNCRARGLGGGRLRNHQKAACDSMCSGGAPAVASHLPSGIASAAAILAVAMTRTTERALTYGAVGAGPPIGAMALAGCMVAATTVRTALWALTVAAIKARAVGCTQAGSVDTQAATGARTAS